jgi:signal transduction histidine kinase
MATITDQIRAEPHIEIGAIIFRDAPELVEVWCDRARAEQPTAARRHHEVLRNQLGNALKAMGGALRQSGSREPRELRDKAIEHGEQRWDTGWSLTELIRDYQILQSVVLDHLDRTLGRPLLYSEAMAVGVFINDAIAASIAAYVANRDHEVRAIEREGMETIREAQRRKDNFLAIVVHELRNPLSPIVNAAKGLSIALPDPAPQIADSLRIIERQSRHLTRILDDLTDLTRLAQGRLRLTRQVVDAGDIVEHALQATMSQILARNHRVSLDIGDRPLAVDGDATRLIQVVVNLLNNACKYTPPGGDIGVVVRRSEAFIVIRIRDSGVGIAPDMLTQVFDLYTRLHETHDNSPDGLGIGLSLVRDLVTLHGGSVECTSDGEGCGAEFIVRLPGYDGPQPVEHVTPASLPAFLG